jgi:mono-ADP-ribosyltransferase sirtuin 6
MSLGYAEKLSHREDLGGKLGAPELSETTEELDAKVTRLANLVRGQATWFFLRRCYPTIM